MNDPTNVLSMTQQVNEKANISSKILKMYMLAVETNLNTIKHKTSVKL